ncbi:MAG: hypothetical protein QG616_2310 [Pseudomonadota bacterium]|nr:hypothetical protein [Pseudomonadota bacterium]MDQ5882478.1 hypothetical protein [Pseudomonadota bacterium]MDQ5903957.1 hypothetical protein [Pseudomonadota bacterium]MDQ5906603.1 hypothetical protein [Pseudomonadota bacterium]MDQ5918952.1 hypothetical protein [Pseudomonadota bacterium]
MNAYVLLLAESLLSVAASLVVVYALSQPLMKVLTRICPDEQAASFWLSYTKIMLILAPLLMVLTVDLFTHFSNPIDTLRLALIAAMGGLLVGLRSVGKRIGQFVSVPLRTGGAS